MPWLPRRCGTCASSPAGCPGTAPGCCGRSRPATRWRTSTRCCAARRAPTTPAPPTSSAHSGRWARDWARAWARRWAGGALPRPCARRWPAPPGGTRVPTRPSPWASTCGWCGRAGVRRSCPWPGWRAPSPCSSPGSGSWPVGRCPCRRGAWRGRSSGTARRWRRRSASSCPACHEQRRGRSRPATTRRRSGARNGPGGAASRTTASASCGRAGWTARPSSVRAPCSRSTRGASGRRSAPQPGAGAPPEDFDAVA